MRTRFLLFLVLLLTGSIYAQQGWFQLTSGTTTWINDVDFVDAKTGWAVGNDGVILHTSDGNNWTTQQSLTTNKLYSVAFVNDQVGWIVGESGKILKTVNGGLNWTSQTSGTSASLQAVFFIDQNFGWIAGTTGTILVTDNGGLLWEPQPTPTVKALLGIYFVNYLTGWATGNEGVIMRSIDGGITWVAQTNHPLNGSLTAINDAFFVSTQEGWVVAKAGNILHTTNGGLNWSKQTTGTNMGFNDAFFYNADTGYVVGDGGMIKYTTNGGASWANQNSTVSSLFLGVDFPAYDTGYVVGNGGMILCTHDGGICPYPNILSQPSNHFVCPGDTVTFSVATDDTAATFQWFKNNTELPGEVSNTIQLDSVSIANAGSYNCKITNGCGTTPSGYGILSIRGPATVTNQPQDQTVEVGDKVTISLTASGSQISAQWMKNGVDIPNATTFSYAIDSIVLADSGYYSCKVSNACNIAYSDSAYIDVKDYSSILSFEDQASLTFFPNPARDRLYLEIDNLNNDHTSVEITNYSGQIVFQKQYGNKSGLIQDIIDLSDKSKGIYFIRFFSGNKVLTDKLVLY